VTLSLSPWNAGGVVTSICVDESEVIVPATPPNVTAEAAASAVPVIVTEVPPAAGPSAEITDVIVGGATAQVSVTYPGHPAERLSPSCGQYVLAGEPFVVLSPPEAPDEKDHAKASPMKTADDPPPPPPAAAAPSLQ
jgi:hypothetical protein